MNLRKLRLRNWVFAAIYAACFLTGYSFSGVFELPVAILLTIIVCTGLGFIGAHVAEEVDPL